MGLVMRKGLGVQKLNSALPASGSVSKRDPVQRVLLCMQQSGYLVPAQPPVQDFPQTEPILYLRRDGTRLRLALQAYFQESLGRKLYRVAGHASTVAKCYRCCPACVSLH